MPQQRAESHLQQASIMAWPYQHEVGRLHLAHQRCWTEAGHRLACTLGIAFHPVQQTCSITEPASHQTAQQRLDSPNAAVG